MTEKKNIRTLIDNREWKNLLAAAPAGTSQYPLTAQEFNSLKVQASKANVDAECPYRYGLSYNYDTSIATVTKTEKQSSAQSD